MPVNPLIFFVYPGPKGSEEPSPDFSGRARRSQNQFTLLGDGVNKLIFKLFGILVNTFQKSMYLNCNN